MKTKITCNKVRRFSGWSRTRPKLVSLLRSRPRHKKPDFFLGFLEHQEIFRNIWGYLEIFGGIFWEKLRISGSIFRAFLGVIVSRPTA